MAPDRGSAYALTPNNNYLGRVLFPTPTNFCLRPGYDIMRATILPVGVGISPPVPIEIKPMDCSRSR